MITLGIIIITALVSIFAFNSREWFERLLFHPYSVNHDNQVYRFLSYGLVHANWTHLLFNMMVLYFFGLTVEKEFHYLFGSKYLIYFSTLYIGGIVFSTLADFGKHKNNSYYRAVGASGAVSAVLFSFILLYPLDKIYFIFIPIGIPAFIFGFLYLAYSVYMAKREVDNIGHDAHFWGALYGLVFTIILKPSLVNRFIDQISNLI